MTYLDNAATTLRKPPSVARAVAAAIKRGANAGRSGGASGEYAGRLLLDCRVGAAELFGASPDDVVFTLNATHALNIAIATLAVPGTRAVISGYEHNAVYRPLMARRDAGVETVVVHSSLFEPEEFLHRFEQQLERGATLAVCTHVSNVFGYILPIERIDALCAARGIPLIIDASQSAGILPLNVSALSATRFVCMPGHKGLYGPQGTGLLLCKGCAQPLLYGGTGGDSENIDMPDYLPERLEAGTQNLPGIAGLLEGIRFVSEFDRGTILAHERRMVRKACERLAVYPKVVTHVAQHMFCQTGVLSVTVRGFDSADAGNRLAAMGFGVRAGLHCAPLAHKSAGTEDGTVRISPSIYTKAGEMNAVADALGRASRGAI